MNGKKKKLSSVHIDQSPGTGAISQSKKQLGIHRTVAKIFVDILFNKSYFLKTLKLH
jgi:hypothetical protein